MNVKGRWSDGGLMGRGRGKERIRSGEKDPRMLHVYVQRQHNETHETLYIRGEGKGEMGM
jgi:hypothetical protein